MPKQVQDEVQGLEPGQLDIVAVTPIGKLAARGMRVSDIISLLTLIGMVGILFGGAHIVKQVYDHQNSTEMMGTKFISMLRENTIAQRMQTCILSMPQEKREQEYMSSNGFCRQMAALP